MRRVASLLLFCVLVTSVTAAEKAFRPGEVWPDNNGVHINSHGGGILVHNGTFYWFGQHMIEGRPGNLAQVGVHVYSSKNLYDWKDGGIALRVSEDPQSDIAKGCILERPKVIYNRKTGKFVMWFHLELKGKGYRAARSGVAVADQVTGPYRFIESFRPNAGVWPINVPDELKGPLPAKGGPVPKFLFQRDHVGGQMARDMTLFVDDDETAYHVYASEDNGTLQISQLTDDYVPTGSMKVTVEDASKFKPGDFVDVQKTPNQAWIDALGMGSITSKRGDRKGKPWKPQQYKCAHLRHVVAVKGNTLTLNAPLTQTLAKGHGGGVVFLRDDKTREVNCGVESLRIVSNYDTTIMSDEKAGEPYPADEKNTLQTGVLITNCIDGWVRNVTVQHANFSAVQCGRNSYRTTVRDCKCLAMVSVIRGGKRYPFSNSDAVMSLFFNCFAETGRHDFAGGSRDTGPNAYVMCRAGKSNLVTGPHQRWGTGYLFDNVVIEGNRQSGLEAMNRGAGGSGQGWAGANTVFWNCTANSAHVMDPPTPEQNFVIGFTGGQTSGDGHVESPDKHVQPQSLFLQQLKERLGDKVVAMYPIPAKR